MQEQQHQWRQQPPKREFSLRLLGVILILLAALAALYFYIVPFLGSVSGGSTGNAFSGG